MLVGNTEELAQNKLLLLYIIDSSKSKFTSDELVEFILSREYMNYFLVTQYLLELVNSDFIEIKIEDSKEKYSILEKGSIALDYFKDRIPESIKADMASEFTRQEDIEKRKSQIVTEYYQKENEQYVVNLKLIEMDDTLFSIYLDVSTLEQANDICRRWEENPEYIYQNIIKILTEDKMD